MCNGVVISIASFLYYIMTYIETVKDAKQFFVFAVSSKNKFRTIYHRIRSLQTLYHQSQARWSSMIQQNVWVFGSCWSFEEVEAFWWPFSEAHKR